LLDISLGPVQDFIAAARRTADLQAGSDLLVRLAQVVAEVVADKGTNTLIFPSSVASDGPNKILVQVNRGDPTQLAASAKSAAQNYLKKMWEETLVSLSHLKNLLDEPLADSQVERFLEFYAAWVPLTSEAEYHTMRIEVDRLLAGRKALRQFEQCDEALNQTRRQRQKSPLDPSQDCVIRTDAHFRVPKACDKYPLWLKSSEALDAISIVKRVQGVEQSNNIPSTSQMAANGLLPELRVVAPDAIKTLEAIVQRSGKGVDIGDLVFESRHTDVLL
jgi:CRISPR-associated protein Cmr2